jgi:hypothetical protein
MMSDARYVERLILRHNEGPPGKGVARSREPFYDHLLVWGYGALEILTRAQQSIQIKEDGGVAACVNLEPLFEPQGGEVFVQVWPQPLLDSLHSAPVRLAAFNSTHTVDIHQFGCSRRCPQRDAVVPGE